MSLNKIRNRSVAMAITGAKAFEELAELAQAELLEPSPAADPVDPGVAGAAATPAATVQDPTAGAGVDPAVIPASEEPEVVTLEAELVDPEMPVEDQPPSETLVSAHDELFEAAYEELKEDFKVTEEKLEKLTQAHDVLETAGGSPEEQAKAVADATALLFDQTDASKDDKFKLGVESFTDVAMAKAVIRRAIEAEAVKAEVAGAGLINRMIDGMASFFDVTARFEGRISRARAIFNKNKAAFQGKTLKLSISDAGLVTTKQGAVGGETYIKTLNSNLDAVSQISDLTRTFYLSLDDFKIKVFSSAKSEAYLKAFTDMYVGHEKFMDQCTRLIKPDAKKTTGDITTLMNTDFLGSLEPGVQFPTKDFTYEGAFIPEAQLNMACDYAKKCEVNGWWKHKADDHKKVASGAGASVFDNMTVQGVEEMFSAAESAFKELSERAKWLKRIDREGSIAVDHPLGTYTPIRTVRMFRIAQRNAVYAARSFYRAEMDLMQTAVKVAERCSNPTYWK